MGKNVSVNLLRGQEKGFLEKFVTWALGVGRVILMATEIIALGAFLYRFSLDRQIIDLNEKIKQEQRVVSLLKPQEDQYRGLQARIASIQALEAIKYTPDTLFVDIVQRATGKLSFNTITITGGIIKIDANAQSFPALNQFITELKNYDPIKTVSLDSIENKTSQAVISVSITAVLKEAQPQ